MNIDELKNKIENELGLSGMPEAARNKIISMLGENCLKRASLAIFERLTGEERAEFEKIAANGNYEEASRYASSKIPDFENFVKEEIRREIAEFKKLSGVS